MSVHKSPALCYCQTTHTVSPRSQCATCCAPYRSRLRLKLTYHHLPQWRKAFLYTPSWRLFYVCNLFLFSFIVLYSENSTKPVPPNEYHIEEEMSKSSVCALFKPDCNCSKMKVGCVCTFMYCSVCVCSMLFQALLGMSHSPSGNGHRTYWCVK